MKKNVAVWVEGAVVWEIPVGPLAVLFDDDDLIDVIRAMPWSALSADDEPEGWPDVRMEIRGYE